MSIHPSQVCLKNSHSPFVTLGDAYPPYGIHSSITHQTELEMRRKRMMEASLHVHSGSNGKFQSTHPRRVSCSTQC